MSTRTFKPIIAELPQAIELFDAVYALQTLTIDVQAPFEQLSTMLANLLGQIPEYAGKKASGVFTYYPNGLLVKRISHKTTETVVLKPWTPASARRSNNSIEERKITGSDVRGGLLEYFSSFTADVICKHMKQRCVIKKFEVQEAYENLQFYLALEDKSVILDVDALRQKCLDALRLAEEYLGSALCSYTDTVKLVTLTDAQKENLFLTLQNTNRHQFYYTIKNFLEKSAVDMSYCGYNKTHPFSTRSHRFFSRREDIFEPLKDSYDYFFEVLAEAQGLEREVLVKAKILKS